MTPPSVCERVHERLSLWTEAKRPECTFYASLFSDSRRDRVHWGLLSIEGDRLYLPGVSGIGTHVGGHAHP